MSVTLAIQDQELGSMLRDRPEDLPALLSQRSNTSHSEDVYSVFSDSLRTYLTYLLGCIIMLSTLTATIYFPLIPLLSKELSVSVQAINLTVTIYAACQGLSPSLFATLADSYGRRPVLLVLIGIYACASLGLALNRQSYGALIALRALQSIGGSATPAIAYGIVADVSVVSERGKMLGPMLSTCNGISALGPVIGGVVAQSTNTVTWVFLALLILSLVFFVMVGFSLPETARSIVGNGSIAAQGVLKLWPLFRRPKSLFDRSRINTSHSGSGERAVPPQLAKVEWRIWSALHPFRMILFPDAAAVLWMVAASYGVYYTIQVAIPVIFEEIYDYNNLQIGLIFLPGLAGMTFGGIVAGKLVDRNFAKVAKEQNMTVDRKKGKILEDFPIEAARYRHCLFFVAFEVGLVVSYGWAVTYHVHAAVPLVLQFFICAMSTLLSHTASALLVDIFPDKSSTSYASSQIMRCGFSAVAAAVLQPLVDTIERGWYFTGFGLFIGLSSLVSVIISRRKGMEWRQKRWRRQAGKQLKI